MAYSKYGLSFKNFTDSYGEWEANGGVEQANKAIDFKNLQNNSFNVRGLPGGTFGQSVIDSTLGVVGNIDDFLGGPTGLGDYANNYVTAQEMAMGEKPKADFSWDYLINGLPRDTGNLIGSGISLAAPIAAATLAAPFVGVGATAAGIGGALAGAGLESMAEGGQKMRDSLANGDSLETAQDKARTVAGENMALLAPTNILGLGALKKVGQGLKTAYNGGKAVSATGGALANYPKLSQVADFAKGAGWAGLGAMNEGAQEAWQQGIQDSVEPDTDWGILPWNWNDEQTEAFESTIGPTALMAGVGGGARLAARKLGMSDVPQVDTAPQVNNNLFGAGTAEISTQGADIDEQVAHLKDGYQSVIPQVAGVLVNDFGIEGAQISSGFRTREHNKEVGGAENSYHVGDGEHGDALDIVLPDGTSAETAEAIKQRFENSGVFDEVLFHDAGSGYHLHLGGLKTDNIGNSYGSYSGNADVDSAINEMAEKYNLDPALLAAIAEQESGFNQSAQSEAGALGIMQLMPDTANGLGVDATDLAGNIEGGAKYIKQMLDQFGGDLHKALEAYNGGPGNVGIAQTMKYADEVLQRYEKFKAKSAGTFSWSKPAGTNTTTTTTTDYMKIMSDNNVTADTAGDFLQYVQLLAEDDANANNEQVQKDGAKAVKAIADGSPDVMERVAKELGYGQVKQEVEQEAPDIPMPKIRQHVQKNGWVEFGSKENADEFARTDYGKTLERVSNTRFVSPDFNAITGRVEQRTAQPQQVAQPAPQPTVQNKVQSDVASTDGQKIANNAAVNNTTVGNLLSSIPNSAISLAKTLSQNPAAVSYNGNNVDLNKLNNSIKNNDIKTINGFNAHMMNNMRKNNVSLDDVVKAHLPVAKDTAMRLSKIPEAITGAAGNRVDLRGLQEAINNNDLSRINAISEKMAENLRSNRVSPYLAMRDTESVEEAPTGSILPAVQGNRAPSTDVQDLGWRVEGEVESPIAPPAPYTEAQLEAPAIESERDTLTSQEFLGKLNNVERQFMEYLDSVFDNTGVAFVDIMQHLNSQRNSLLGKAIEMFKNGYAVDSVVFSRMNDTQRSALVNYRRMLDVYGNSLTNADRDVIDEFTRLDNIINEYLAPMAHNYLINNNVLNYRGIDNAIKGLEGIAAKAREYEQIKVSEGYREGRATGNKVVPREDEEAISGSATAWGNVLHQTQKRGLPAETERTKVQRFIKTLPNKIVQKSHSNSLNAMTNYAGEKITKAERVERVIKNGDSIQKIENEYFIIAPSGNIKVTKSEYNYYNYLLNERKNDKSNNGSKEYTSTSHETAYEGRKSLAESNYKRGDVSVPENASNDEIGDLDIKTDDLKEVSDSNVREKTKSTVITDDGKEFNVVYKVMPADDVVASNLPTDGLPVNSKYPSAMQPRNRQRVAMQEQITSMSNNLRPADLAESRNLNQGAPVIKSDGAVLNGNGRTIAIQRAWLNGKADKYKQYLLDNAEKLGINPADIEGTEHPILVRVVQDKLSKDDIMSMINSTTGGQRMSPSEQAKVDSGKIKSSTLNQYVAGSDLTSAANRNFLRDVLADIISPSERNAYYSKEGAINQDGVLRAQRALFALAYGDDTLLDAFSEAVNEEAKNFSNALKANAPLIARLQQLIKTGNATDLGLQKNLVSAVKALKEAVIAGKPAKSIWQEMSMFEDTEHSPETIAIARAMDGYRRSGKKLTQFVRNLAELGLKHGNPNQSGLFGEDEAPQVKLTDDIATAKEYVDTGNQMDMFAPKYSRDKNVDNKGNMKDNKNRKISDEYDKLEKEEKAVVDEAVNDRINQLFSRVADYVQRGFDDAFSADDGKAGINKLLEDSRKNDVLKNLLQYANRFSATPSNYKEVLNTLAPGLNTDRFTKEQLVERYNEYRDVAREMLNYGQYVYAELCERHRQHYAGLREHGGQNAGAGTVRSRNEEARRFDWEREQAEVVTKLFRRQETFNFNKKHSEKNSRSAFSFANPDTAEELKSTGNIDTPLDRLPKLPASKLRDSERKMQAFGKAIGVPVHFVNHPDKGYRGVFTHNGEVYINRNATVPAKAIFLHEFTHWLKASGKENRAVFDALAACVERDSGLFHERRLKQYRDRIFGGEQMTDEEIIEEIICDAMGNSKTAERISKAIDNFAPELNQSIWGRIKAMWDKFCKMVGFRQELSSKKQSLPNGLSQQEMAKFNAQLNILMSKMRTADGKPMFKVENYQLVVAENGKRPAEIFDINNVNDYVPTYNIPLMPSSFSYQVHTQREAVRQQYEGTKEWMKAPNGEPTNLTEEQWLDVRTPNFKAWFGDWENNPDEASKVVDENGEPLVVYHGSESNFDEFDTAKARANMDIQGMFFSPIQEEANDYGENVRAFFLNIKNPADYDTGYNALKNHKGENLAGEKARNDLMENGYDGVNNDGEEYIAFNPNQIKSATENTGAFSPDTNNIKYSRAENNNNQNETVVDNQQEAEDNNRQEAEDDVDFAGDNPVSRGVFKKYILEDVRRDIRNAVQEQIGDTISDFKSLRDPVKLDKAFSLLPFAKMTRVTFNMKYVQKDEEKKNVLAAQYEYARRCFLYDDRISAEMLRQDVNDKEQIGMAEAVRHNITRNVAGGQRGRFQNVRRGGAIAAGLNDNLEAQLEGLRSSFFQMGEYKGIKEHFDKLIEKHSEQGAFSDATKNSRDKAGITASTDNVGIFKRAMTALENKLKGKMPDNLDVRTYEDIEADRENARRAKAASRGKEYLDRSKEVSPLGQWWASPSRFAKKIPLISPFVQMGKIAVDKQEKLRVEFNSGMNEIEDLLGYSKWGLNDKRYKERKMALQEALLQGDINRKVFTDNELKSGGLDEQTIKAYHKMRELLDKAYTMADQTYSRTKYVSRNWSTAAEADGFMNDLMKKNPFVQIIQKKQNADGTVTYTYKEPHQYTVSALTVTAAELDELKKNKDVIIKSERLISGSTPTDSTYSVTYHQKKANLGKIQGYIPHIFHGWLVCEVDKNGNIIKDSAGNIVVATSKNSMSEAVKEGKKIASQNTGKRYIVMPKLGKFSDGAAERAAIMGDFDYSKTMSRVANGMKMSIADAEKFMNGTVAVQNRGRFLAYAQHRKGVQGYEQNVFLATQMYFNQIARYVALDPFKRDAISMYNRLFGSFTDNTVTRRSENAKYVYAYINDMNGMPSGFEKWANKMLHNMGLGQEVANGRPTLWLERMIFTYPFTIAKLGVFNVSSALLNLTQLFNLYGAMGEKVLSSAGYERLLKKGFMDARKAIVNKNSPLGQLVWKDLGLEAQIGIDVAGGYSRTEVNGLASLTGRLSKLAGGSMYLFRLSDTYTRAVTLLTAYNKALDEGMTKQEAIEYAKEINDKVNFDYSVADSPAIFRAGGPLSNVLLQFQKYPVKQIELFMDIFNDGRAAGLNRKQSALRLMKYTAPYMAFSGMMGIPFISLAGGILSAIMSAATGDDDWDWQQKIKQYMVETFGADNPLTLWWLYGAGSFIGINVGSRVGVGDFMGIENREKSPIDSILGMTTATSTVAQTTKQLGYGNYAEAVKAISPSAGNILIGLKGEVHTTRGRMKYQYQNAYEQALRMIGFNPLNETMAGDIASNDYANKQAEKRAKDDAIDAFIEEPTAENAARLNELGVTPKSIQTEMARRKMNRAELNRLAEEEKAAKAKKSKQKKKQYSVNDYLKGK